MLQVVQEYERAVIFRLGRLLHGGSRGPGKTGIKLYENNKCTTENVINVLCRLDVEYMLSRTLNVLSGFTSVKTFRTHNL